MKRLLFLLLTLSACTSDSTQSNIPENASMVAPNPVTVSKPLPPIDTPVIYEIIRKPNDGIGVFDYMYIVHVAQKINRREADWIFNDIINKHRQTKKMAISIWDNKAAFFEELKAYQREDAAYNNYQSIKELAKETAVITAKNDIHKIAEYTNNGEEITKEYSAIVP